MLQFPSGPCAPALLLELSFLIPFGWLCCGLVVILSLAFPVYGPPQGVYQVSILFDKSKSIKFNKLEEEGQEEEQEQEWTGQKQGF